MTVKFFSAAANAIRCKIATNVARWQCETVSLSCVSDIFCELWNALKENKWIFEIESVVKWHEIAEQLKWLKCRKMLENAGKCERIRRKIQDVKKKILKNFIEIIIY